jgi:uncharacterized Zn finger protein
MYRQDYSSVYGVNRVERALVLYRSNKIIHKGNNKYLVPSQTQYGQSYQVRYPYRCTCPDYQKRRKSCKHILAAGMMIKHRRMMNNPRVKSSSRGSSTRRRMFMRQ